MAGLRASHLARTCARLSYNTTFKSAQRILTGELRASIWLELARVSAIIIILLNEPEGLFMGELGASIWLELAHASSIIILSNEPDAYTPHPYQHIPLNPISTYPSLVALFLRRATRN